MTRILLLFGVLITVMQIALLSYYALSLSGKGNPEYVEGFAPQVRNGFHPSTRVAIRKMTARDIVEDAYNKTFRIIEEECAQYMYGPSQPLSLKFCIADLYKRQNSSSNLPWWFRTMLRDASDYHVHADFHNMSFYDIPLNLCVMEKIGSSEWREIHCRMNTKKNDTGAKYCPEEGGKVYKDGPLYKAVFLRDPLTRFLSAFIDKCAGYRRIERHCEPDRLFYYDLEKQAEKNKLEAIGKVFNESKKDKSIDELLIEDFLKDKRLFFQTYSDVIGLKWNIHFFPQSLYCNGLYRTIQTYNFVGNMNATFSEQLDVLKSKYGEPFSAYVAEKYQSKTSNVAKSNRGGDTSSSRNSSAAKRVLEYFTPETVRRLLKYYSIDYMKLALPIPDWADEILAQENGMLR